MARIDPVASGATWFGVPEGEAVTPENDHSANIFLTPPVTGQDGRMYAGPDWVAWRAALGNEAASLDAYALFPGLPPGRARLVVVQNEVALSASVRQATSSDEGRWTNSGYASVSLEGAENLDAARVPLVTRRYPLLLLRGDDEVRLFTNAQGELVVITQMWIETLTVRIETGETTQATRQYPRDDTAGWSSSPRVYPPPRSGRVYGGHL